MTKQIDLVYERLIAEEEFKKRTKYERLAAMAFRTSRIGNWSLGHSMAST